MSVDLGALWSVPGFLALLIAVAFLSKLVGAGAPARLAGLDRRESLAVGVGVGVSARGVVELVVATIALHAGLFVQSAPGDRIVPNLYSAVVLTSVVTTLLAPLLLRPLLRNRPPE
ncbi:MAG: hypothetical protein CL569_06480 [Alphaproteobacteria bacterium]|nr:hypothetical protein [Alphaproteobacteria bacterium]|tara:strand:- start:529 stop:876 length:348 start_codon:yes stop_codon:yes gene_type:complete